MHSAYAVLPRVRKSRIKPSEQIEVELFITGYGLILKNKIFISFSSPKLIDSSNPGVLDYSIKTAKNQETGEIMGPVSGKPYKESRVYGQIGLFMGLSEGNFLDVPNRSVNSNIFPQIMTESAWDGDSPFLLKLNTSKEVTSGDYEIYIAFTYSDGKETQIDKTKVTIHIQSWVEIHQKKLQWIAIILGSSALASGILQAVYTVLQYIK